MGRFGIKDMGREKAESPVFVVVGVVGDTVVAMLDIVDIVQTGLYVVELLGRRTLAAAAAAAYTADR